MKKLLLLTALLCVGFVGYSQNSVGIGTTSPNNKSILDLSSSNQGLLIPRVDDAGMAAIGASIASDDGMLIYNTSQDQFMYFEFSSGTWEPLSGSGNLGWELTGNSGTTSSDFVGTIDKQNLRFRTENLERMIIDTNGNIGIGTGSAILNRLTLSIPSTNSLTSTSIYLDNYYSGANDKYGIDNYVSPLGSGAKYGVKNLVLQDAGNGNGAFGVHNQVGSDGAGTFTGTWNELTGTGTGSQNGTLNSIFNNGTGQKNGTYNAITQNAGSNSLRGVFNNMSHEGTGVSYSVLNIQSGTGTGDQYGVRNSLSNTGTGTKYATYNYLYQTSNNATLYGVYNYMRNNGNLQSIGMYNYDANSTGSGTQTGVFTVYTNSGTGMKRGSQTTIQSAGTNSIYGSSANLTHSGTGNIYGYYAIMSGANANKYGVYVSGEDWNYFSSNVGIGTTAPTQLLDVEGTAEIDSLRINNSYAFPTSDGAAGQALTTDGAGNITWQTPPASNDWSLAGNAITAGDVLGTTNAQDLVIIAGGNTAMTINNSTQNIGIGTTVNPISRINVAGSSTSERTLELYNTYSGASPTYGIINTVNNSATGVKWGFYNYVNAGTSTSTIYGTSNIIANTTTGLNRGTYNDMQVTGSGAQYGTTNDLNNSGTGVRWGTYNDIVNTVNSADATGTYNLMTKSSGASRGTYNVMQGSGTATEYGVYNLSINTGTGLKRGTYNDIRQATGTNTIYGIENRMDHDGTGASFGTYNRDAGSGSGTHYGTYNSMNATATGTKYGVYNNVYGNAASGSAIYGTRNYASHGGTGASYGTSNTINTTNNNQQYGTLNSLSNGGTGARYGVNNYVYHNGAVAGTSSLYGTYSYVGHNGSAATIYATYGQLSGTNVIKYGAYYTGEDRNYFSGRVGIGETIPQADLHINGSMRYADGTQAAGRILVSDGLGNASWDDASSASYNIYTGNGALSTDRTVSHGTSTLTFNLNSTGTFQVQDAGVNKFLINDAGTSFFGGNVWFRSGNTGGTNLVAVTDNTGGGRIRVYNGASIQHDIRGNANTVFNQLGSSLDFRVESAADQYALFVDGSANNVGVGSSVPNTKLHIDGGSDAALATGGYFTIGATTGYNLSFDNNEFMARNNGAIAPLYIQNDGGSLLLHNNLATTTRVIIDNNGNLGLGNTAPTTKFDMSTTGWNGATFRGNNTGDVFLRLSNDPATYYHYIFDDQNGGNNLKIESANDLVFHTGGVNQRMRIYSTGDAYINNRLGVGVVPNSSYAVYAAGTAYGVRGSGSTRGAWFEDSDGTSLAYLATGTVGIYAQGDAYGADFYDTNNGARMRIAYGTYGLYQTGGSFNYLSTATGIGVTNAAYRLVVYGVSGNYAAEFNRVGTDGSIIRFTNDAVFAGSISVAGGTVSYNAFTGSHYGWSNKVHKIGELVVLTGDNRYANEEASIDEPIYGFTTSNTANDPKALGSYLDEINDGEEGYENAHRIMAVGNGDMFVVNNGENLEIGDYLISSNVAGHAMLDKGDYDVSYIIARVAEPVDWSKVTTTVDGKKSKRISVFFESFTINHKADKLEKELAKVKADYENIKADVEFIKSNLNIETTVEK